MFTCSMIPQYRTPVFEDSMQQGGWRLEANMHDEASLMAIQYKTASQTALLVVRSCSPPSHLVFGTDY